MLVSAKEMMTKALAGKYAVGQFNINNLEWTKAILLTAQELQSPVILGVSEGAGKYMTGFKTVAAMVKAMDEELGITVPVALHLDHGTYEGCYKCVKAGFSSIMFDGSHYPFDENLAKSTELVHVADQLGLSADNRFSRYTKELEKEFDDDAESVITDQRYVYIQKRTAL